MAAKRTCPVVKETCHYTLCTGSVCQRKASQVVPINWKPSAGPSAKRAAPAKGKKL